MEALIYLIGYVYLPIDNTLVSLDLQNPDKNFQRNSDSDGEPQNHPSVQHVLMPPREPALDFLYTGLFEIGYPVLEKADLLFDLSMLLFQFRALHFRLQ